jgi:DNA-binding NarL/FixJ family response regulator
VEYGRRRCGDGVEAVAVCLPRRLGVTEATVRKHLENIYARLHVSSRTAAVTRALPGPGYAGSE